MFKWNKKKCNLNNICNKCIKIKKQKIIDIGKTIENTIKMRLKFKLDEYVKRINVDGLENYYVSNYSKIFNYKKQELHGHTNLLGYINVRLLFYNKNTLFRLHRLICITFNGKINKDKILLII